MKRYTSQVFPWNDALDTKPENYELVNVKYPGGKVRMAWWSGSQWDSVASETNQKILEWQKSAMP